MSLQKPCLPVSHGRRRKRDDDETTTDNLFDDIDALDAATYLRRVQEQARRLPEVFESSSEKPPEKKRCTVPGGSDHQRVTIGSAASLQCLLVLSGIEPPPTAGHAPDARWVDQTCLASFSRLRDYLEQCRGQGVGGREGRVPVPPMKDRSGWYVFCVGPDNAAAASSGDAVGGGDGDDREAPAWRQNVPVSGYAPTVSLLLQLDQVMVRRVLGHLTHYCCRGDDSGRTIIQQLAPWLYALLARLEQPIHRDDAVTLYSLLKALGSARASTTAAEEYQREIAALNVLIAVVGIYFEQGGGYADLMEVKGGTMR